MNNIVTVLKNDNVLSVANVYRVITVTDNNREERVIEVVQPFTQTITISTGLKGDRGEQGASGSTGPSSTLTSSYVGYGNLNNEVSGSRNFTFSASIFSLTGSMIISGSSFFKGNTEVTGNFIVSGEIASNYGFRSDSVGFRIGTNSTLNNPNTAIFTISGGTTSAAQIHLDTGVSASSPTNGDIWREGVNLKTRLGGYTYNIQNVVFRDLSTPSITGTTSDTIIGDSILISGSTFGPGDMVKVRTWVGSSGASGTSTIKFMINTVDSMSGATTFGWYSGANILFPLERHLVIKSASDTRAAFGSIETTQISDFAQVGNNANTHSGATYNIDWTVDQYIICVFKPSVVGAVSRRLFFDVMKQ